MGLLDKALIEDEVREIRFKEYNRKYRSSLKSKTNDARLNKMRDELNELDDAFKSL